MTSDQTAHARTPAGVRLWRNRDFVLLEGGQQVSALGTSISGLALLLLDRDLNAAMNLAKLAGSLSDSLNACGADSAGSSRKAGVQLSARGGPRARKKQERNAT